MRSLGEALLPIAKHAWSKVGGSRRSFTVLGSPRAWALHYGFGSASPLDQEQYAAIANASAANVASHALIVFLCDGLDGDSLSSVACSSQTANETTTGPTASLSRSPGGGLFYDLTASKSFRYVEHPPSLASVDISLTVALLLREGMREQPLQPRTAHGEGGRRRRKL
eukprot:gnl/TRDRNA2_/TRDRNA2_90237_c0_seq2.p1 gnl/TRDRNA2_/TRDRNA2_90237_c0~~gnl/TRDRNA2_/TRDRNA2_90237_c0_seq2.p1  ORF type:complete len:168 (+),score=8.65 gnl/TRDRNA2_/TRDRNA2_90237_c0_seq2:56-559(+)